MNNRACVVLAAAIAISLTMIGCKKESPANAPSPSRDAAVTAQLVAAASSDLPLPGLKLAFPYQVQSDSTFTQSKTGQLRRAIVLEFKDGDIRTMFDLTADALKGMGYTTKAEPLVGDSVISQSFFGRGGAYLEVRKNVGARPKDPASAGVVALSWPIKSVEEPAPLFQ